MTNIRPITSPVDPLEISPRIMQLAIHLAGIVQIAAELLAEQSAKPEAKPAESEPSGLVASPKAAKALGVSVPTLHRFRIEGMPHTFAGQRVKFDVALCREWLALRGRKPTRAKPPADNVDVDNVLRRAGLREVG